MQQIEDYHGNIGHNIYLVDKELFRDIGRNL